MTKMIRVENADANTSYKVIVTEQTRDAEGNWNDGQKRELTWPAAMETIGIHDGKRVIVEEAPNELASKG